MSFRRDAMDVLEKGEEFTGSRTLCGGSELIHGSHKMTPRSLRSLALCGRLAPHVHRDPRRFGGPCPSPPCLLQSRAMSGIEMPLRLP
mmetsp:Transcript_59237/g.105271  ORF Transcript_59237/g.105271 Transcript_59237/m.105271 type:complete len:88 (-) Transcript_59237:379-642(-)